MAIEADLLERTLHLSEQDRADLARRLILSLESSEPDADVDRAWEAEIEQRLARFDRGETTAVDWRQAIDRARSAVRRGALQ